MVNLKPTQSHALLAETIAHIEHAILEDEKDRVYRADAEVTAHEERLRQRVLRQTVSEQDRTRAGNEYFDELSSALREEQLLKTSSKKKRKSYVGKQNVGKHKKRRHSA